MHRQTHCQPSTGAARGARGRDRSSCSIVELDRVLLTVSTGTVQDTLRVHMLLSQLGPVVVQLLRDEFGCDLQPGMAGRWTLRGQDVALLLERWPQLREQVLERPL